MKKILIASVFLLIVVGIIVKISKPQIFYSDEITYSGMGGIDTKLNLKDMSYSIGDVFGSVKSCSSEEYPKCIIFDRTIIMLPSLVVNSNLKEDYYEGRNESLNLNYYVVKKVINVLGKKIKGYIFYVGHSNEIVDDETMLGKLKGTYFYSTEYGVLFYDHNSEIILSNSKKERLSELQWSVSMCGLFSNTCSP